VQIGMAILLDRWGKGFRGLRGEDWGHDYIKSERGAATVFLG